MFLESKVGLTTLPPSMSWMSRQCGILNISQPYRLPQPVMGIAFFFYLLSLFWFACTLISDFRTAVLYVMSNLVIGIVTVCIVYQWVGQRRTDTLNISIPEGFIYTLTYDVAVAYMGNLKQLWSALTFFTIICAGFIAMVSIQRCLWLIWRTSLVP
jgi:hypothetical protein